MFPYGRRMNDRKGYLYALTAFTAGGLIPLHIKLLQPTAPTEILAHRVLWGIVLLTIVLTAVQGWRPLAIRIRRPHSLAGIVLAATLAAINWGIQIYGINSGQIVQTSLGYFITPLVLVLFGVTILRERLRPTSRVALGLSILAVAVLVVDYGRPPYIALAVAANFGGYSLVKKRLGAPALEGSVIELAILVPPALGYLAWLASRGDSTYGHVSISHSLLLILLGVTAGGPMVMYASAVNRIPLTALGIMQYIVPSLNFLLGVFVFHEPLPPARLAGFMLVWAALVVFTVGQSRTTPPHLTTPPNCAAVR